MADGKHRRKKKKAPKEEPPKHYHKAAAEWTKSDGTVMRRCKCGVEWRKGFTPGA